MALYLIHALDAPGALPRRLAVRAEHLAWVAGDAPRVLMAGPILAEDGETFAGSCFVIEAASLAEARTWNAADPYSQAGVFDRVDIHAFRWAIGKGPA